MSDFLTYKKLSDLEWASELSSDACIPALDSDGVVKRVPRSYFYVSGDVISGENSGGNGNNNNNTPVVFMVSNGNLVNTRNRSQVAPAEEIVEAYFNGKAMLLPPHGWGGVKDEIVYSYPTGGTAVYACPKPIIGFRISGNA